MTHTELFDQIVDLWPVKGDREEALEQFEKIFPAEINLDEAKTDVDATLKKIRYAAGTTSLNKLALYQYLQQKLIFGKNTSKLPAITAPVSIGLVTADTPVPSSSARESRFEYFWARRPVNPAGFPETHADAKTAYDRAIHEHGTDVVNGALEVFLLEEMAQEWPRHLTTIMNDRELIRLLYHQHVYMPSPEEQEEFDLVWNAYPAEEKNLLPKDAMAKLSVWKRMIPVEERNLFLAHVVAYRRKLKRDYRFAYSWSRFIGEIWKTIPLRNDYPEHARWVALGLAGKLPEMPMTSEKLEPL